jgi:hypothetical protein
LESGTLERRLRSTARNTFFVRTGWWTPAPPPDRDTPLAHICAAATSADVLWVHKTHAHIYIWKLIYICEICIFIYDYTYMKKDKHTRTHARVRARTHARTHTHTHTHTHVSKIVLLIQVNVWRYLYACSLAAWIFFS